MIKRNWLGRIKKFVSKSHSFIPGTVAAVLSVGMWQLGVWIALERMAYNAMFQVRAASFLPQQGWDKRVVTIAIDDASLNAYGNLPWSRERYVQLLRSLQQSSPKVIGFDILFVDPGKNDAKLARAIANSSNVVLATAWDEQGRPLDVLPEFQEAAVGEGQIWHKPDQDGISRKAAAFCGPTPALSLAMLQVGENYRSPLLPHPPAENRCEEVWINWPGKTQDVPTYSFVDVVEGKIPKEALADKFVLVGVTATAVDSIRTPYNQNPPTAGVYLHAAMIDNLLHNKLLKLVKRPVVIFLLLLIGPVTSWLLSNRELGNRAAIAILLPTAWVVLCLASFIDDGWLLPVIAPVGTMLMAEIGVLVGEQYEKQQLMSLFAKHVAPETAKLIWQRKDEIIDNGTLQAQEMTATVLFCDIRGFTTTSEKMPPSELLDWLNRYLDAMNDCIMDHGGVIDKYIGDAIMAVFGIPFAHTKQEEIQQDAMNCLAAAVAMHEKLQQLNQQLQAEGKPVINIGIGVHTGLVVAGSVGGSRRLNYSILGDTVNVAARLEPMNKEVKVNNPYNLIVSGETFAYVCDRYDAHPVDSIQLRGREQPTMIYCIQGERVSSAVKSEAITANAEL